MGQLVQDRNRRENASSRCPPGDRGCLPQSARVELMKLLISTAVVERLQLSSFPGWRTSRDLVLGGYCYSCVREYHYRGIWQSAGLCSRWLKLKEVNRGQSHLPGTLFDLW